MIISIYLYGEWRKIKYISIYIYKRSYKSRIDIFAYNRKNRYIRIESGEKQNIEL